jgi:hypothetical protein
LFFRERREDLEKEKRKRSSAEVCGSGFKSGWQEKRE